MKALEFQTCISADGKVLVPDTVRDQLPPNQPIRVLLLVPEPPSDDDWPRVTAEQFLKGYDASDAIYDNLPSR